MKLWYQSLARQAETLDYGADLRKVISIAAEPGSTVHVQGLNEAAGIGAHFRFLEYHDTKEVIYNAIRAEKEGYDAFLIGNITDAGMREAREMVNHPVAYLVTIHCGWMPIFFAMLACRAMSFLRNSVNSSGEPPTGK